MRVAPVLLFAVVAAPALAAPPEVVAPTVISTRLHDTSAYTQGLLLHDGRLYESAGGYDSDSFGPSTLRKVNPATGVVEESIELPKDAGTADNSYFGEGLARVGDHLIQLTWQENTAFVWSIATFDEVERHSYGGQGWGLCYDGARLVMSDGSATLTFRDPGNFSVLGSVTVTAETLSGGFEPMYWLNELECVGSLVYANVYTTDWILEIDAATGHVLRRIDASGLLTQADVAAGAEVLNGIAHDPATGRFLITGKLWPKLFEVTFGSAGTDGGPTDGSPTDGNPAGDASPADSASPGDARPPSTVRSTGCAASPPWVAALLVAAIVRRFWP